MAGKLNGVMPATTPSGWRSEYMSMPVPTFSVYSPFSSCGMPQANSTTSSPRAHFHLDSALSYGLPRVNQSGTLLEGIALWGELKPLLTMDAIVERALRYCDLAVSQGLLAIRSHVDVCDDRLLAVEALLHVKQQVAPYLDLQLVAFPQDGLHRSATAEKNLLRALDLGVDVVGGIPHFERTMADGARR
jgi:cytosine deaminase